MFDTGLVDINMPGLSGLEAAKLYRFTHPEDQQIPIVALTADATAEARRLSEEAGMDVHLTKPVDAERLLHTMDMLTAAKKGGAAYDDVTEDKAVPEVDDISNLKPWRNPRSTPGCCRNYVNSVAAMISSKN